MRRSSPLHFNVQLISIHTVIQASLNAWQHYAYFGIAHAKSCRACESFKLGVHAKKRQLISQATVGRGHDPPPLHHKEDSARLEPAGWSWRRLGLPQEGHFLAPLEGLAGN